MLSGSYEHLHKRGSQNDQKISTHRFINIDEVALP